MQNFTWKTFTHKSKYEGFIYRPKNYSRFVRIAKIDNVAIKYQIAAFIVRKNISRVKVAIKTNLFFYKYNIANKCSEKTYPSERSKSYWECGESFWSKLELLKSTGIDRDNSSVDIKIQNTCHTRVFAAEYNLGMTSCTWICMRKECKQTRQKPWQQQIKLESDNFVGDNYNHSLDSFLLKSFRIFCDSDE